MNDPLTGSSTRPTAYIFPTRARECNALFHGHPNGYQSPAVASIDAQELTPWYINAVVDNSTDDVHIPAIMNEVTGGINAVIDHVTKEERNIGI